MSKAVLVIDMPENCENCPLFKGYYSDMCCGGNNRTIDYPYPKDFKQDWCPLQPAPEKKAAMIYLDDESYYFRCGWNACVESLEPNKNKV